MRISDWSSTCALPISHVVGPQLGRGAPTFVYDFPASQAALAHVRDGDPPVAERFELFWQGLELANGFHELTDRKSTRLTPVTNAHLVCRLLLEKKKYNAIMT